MDGTPTAEVEIDQELVQTLLQDQHADLADLPLVLLDAGWDNVMFRLGDAYTVRLPRRLVAAKPLLNEQTWLPTLAQKLPLPVPSPVRVGHPGRCYPWNWSILPWLPGCAASDERPGQDQAPIFGRFLRALHQTAPSDAPINEVRGCPLADRAALITARIDRLKSSETGLAPEIEIAVTEGLDAPVSDEARWLHGDLHARNVLMYRGKISAIIDWGDITSGDVATDLAGVWALFDDAEARREALKAYGASVAEVARARAWAVNFGTILLATGLVDNPRHAMMGADTLRRVAADISTKP
ncbi:MAG: aminoglycoside phosphotransferase family protein [Sphingomonas sp.]|nr:aminoglycoside phosphotransferase family protein [Sphingomonas sp.]